MVGSQSYRRNCILPIRRLIRPITVNPEVAPKPIMMIQMPILTASEEGPLVGLLKKK